MLVPLAADLVDEKELQGYADKVVEHIAATAGIPDLAERIITKEAWGPNQFASRYNSMGGTALGLAHTLSQTALFRPASRSKKVKNLYYVGAGVHPGIGLPVCLISAELAYERITTEQ